jgi:hypothetical protein
MPPESKTISLREAAEELARLHASRKSIDDGKLLTLLRNGELSAQFALTDSIVEGIDITAKFWRRVPIERFSSIRVSSSNKKRRGTFTVSLKEFREEYVALAQKRKPPASDWITKELAAAIAAASTPLEPVITMSSWQAYLKQHQLDDPTGRRKGGRYEKQSWRDLCVIIAVHFLELGRDAAALAKAEAMAHRVHEKAEEEGLKDLPSPATIKDVIAKIVNAAKQFPVKAG